MTLPERSLNCTILPDTSQEPMAVSSPAQPRVPPSEPLPRLVRVRNMSQDEPAYETRQLPTIASLVTRSEEHTSELQSLMRISYAVFCLKKKKKNKHTNK